MTAYLHDEMALRLNDLRVVEAETRNGGSFVRAISSVMIENK